MREFSQLMQISYTVLNYNVSKNTWKFVCEKDFLCFKELLKNYQLPTISRRWQQCIIVSVLLLVKVNTNLFKRPLPASGTATLAYGYLICRQNVFWGRLNHSSLSVYKPCEYVLSKMRAREKAVARVSWVRKPWLKKESSYAPGLLFFLLQSCSD